MGRLKGSKNTKAEVVEQPVDLVPVIKNLIKSRVEGLYDVAPRGSLSDAGLTKLVEELLDIVRR